jgi:hypothetical protein
LGIIGGLIGVASLPLAPFRRPVYRFNTWYDAKSRERTANRLIALREQLQELQDRTDHLHFQRKVSGGLLSLTLAFLIWFLRAVRGQVDRETESFSARMFGATDIDLPHFRQNEESSGISVPQPGQNII